MTVTSHITCPDCHRTSHHPEDIRQGYCGHCHWWTSDPYLGPIRKAPPVTNMLTFAAQGRLSTGPGSYITKIHLPLEQQ